MIKYNEATECCVTNGAEAVLWAGNPISFLKTEKHWIHCFVKLVNPPKIIQLDGFA